MIEHYGAVFWQLIRTPFLHPELIWGIVPLYFGWILNELTSGKPSFTTAVQTGFSFLWAGTHWIWQSFTTKAPGSTGFELSAAGAVNGLVTLLVLVVGVLALVSGVRRRYPRYAGFLGHTRFSNYFMIAIFPIQAHYLRWTWDRFLAIALFAVPIWLGVQVLMKVARR